MAVTQEVEVGRLWSKAGVGKSARPCLKNKISKEDWMCGSSG
jgi:hypothetical protein